MPFPNALNVTYDEPSGNRGNMRILGKYGFSGNATMPNGAAGCVVNTAAAGSIGMITDRSIIIIQPWGAGQPLNELKYDITGSIDVADGSSRMSSKDDGVSGSFTVVTSNTLQLTANQKFGFQVINP